MAQRDKNGLTASQRIAKRVFADFKDFKDCHTVVTYYANDESANIRLYGTIIAIVHFEERELIIVEGHDFDGSRLTRERKNALLDYASSAGFSHKTVLANS